MGVESDQTLTERGEQTPDVLRQPFVWSFYHSQGEISLQIMLLEYALRKHPEWKSLKVGEEAFDDPRTHSALTKAINASSAGHGAIDRSYEIKIIRESFQKAMVSTDEPATLEDTLERMVSTDIDYVAKRSELREEAAEKGTEPPPFSYPSHFVAFVIDEEVPPGGSVYREFYRDIREFVKSKRMSDDLKGKIAQLMRDYNAENPDNERELDL